MSVTVEQLLKLPSLNRAKVIGGHRGLSKVVSSISVLESTDPGVLVDEVFPQGEFFGSEIVITGFLNSVDNVPLQLANIRRLAQGGEVGLIIFYVGVYLPRIDPRLIALADELDFVLIVMPEGEATLRYGEVINDVMGCIYRDRAESSSVVLDVLAGISALPKRLQTVNTALKILSDRVSASVLLCDASFHVLNLVTWPRGIEGDVSAGFRAMQSFPPPGGSAVCPFVPDSRMYRMSLAADGGQQMELLLIKAGLPFDAAALGQVMDATRICINIWGRRHGEIAIHELVRAILQDEPLKMHRLAEIFHVDVASLHEMWIAQSHQEDAKERFQALLPALREYFVGFPGSLIMDVYGGRLLIFMGTPQTQQEAERMSVSVMGTVAPQLPDVVFCRCSGLQNTADVREAYLGFRENLADAMRIYPARRFYTWGDIRFSRECRLVVQGGEAALNACLSPIVPIQKDSEELDLAETLSIYLLDGERSVTLTSNLLHIHKNTVKYRLHRISGLLGYRADKMPELLDLYKACAVRRLM
ncbi:PucR family transcriptional regulator [Pseudoflavonifractor phocaeensis]|uniref:PucR family transcriptional regulator n=1 Tax=Pseudoflavonifractor phocaeensis TaxID=1870988 RepID=UPI00195704A4|nr:PucR family transcriptional regulator [Pseudoflavonifractor phocaeensis]MBM6927052.1 PucR family transcriptional regulator ligand-binding domain-containing protein [Pseudoflavonifractor phocaeensis]